MPQMPSPHSASTIRDALEDSIHLYIEQRKALVQPFCARHFSMSGTLITQKKSWTEDLIKNPINALWAIPFLTVRKAADWLDKLGFDRLKGWVLLIPPGLKTRSQREIEAFIELELLQDADGNALKKVLKANPQLKPFVTSDSFVDVLTSQNEIIPELKLYTLKRAQIADVAGTVSALILSHFMFGGRSLDFFQMGRTLARKWAKKDAASHFFLGKTLGSSFYNVAPVHVSATQIRIATASIVFGITLLSFIISLISDPIQMKLSIHERRLNELLDSYQEKLLRKVREHHREAISGDKTS
ncbi:MAG: hypothetical protein H7222_10320 [Methylotenera sp.]|nr:hypothetical protein [Oligoflexia bacterium]